MRRIHRIRVQLVRGYDGISASEEQLHVHRCSDRNNTGIERRDLCTSLMWRINAAPVALYSQQYEHSR